MSSTSGSEDLDGGRLHFPVNKIVREIMLKVLIIGDYGVGKTAIVRRYAEGKFSSNYKITIGADFSIKSIVWDSDTQINIQLWDIAGHERFGYMTRVYYKYAVAAAIVFDVSRIATFQSIQKWLTDVRDKVILSDGSPIPIIIMANKSDISGASIPTDALNQLCKEYNIPRWYSTSAKDNSNIEEALGFLVACAMQNKLKETSEPIDSITLHTSTDKNSKEKICCV